MATSIGLSWNQPHREDEVHFHGYEINYSFEVIECGEELTPAVVVTLNNDSQESYTIKNSSTTPVEEDSKYSISITAVYSVGKSEPSNTVIAITAHTSKLMCMLFSPQITMLCIITAPGIPQFLRINSTSISSVTVWWDRVKCRERNGHTDSYRVVYYPASSYINRIARTVSGTTDSDRMFTATGLVPRTAYIFEVQASNTLLDERGPAATLNVTTTTPQGKKHCRYYVYITIFRIWP